MASYHRVLKVFDRSIQDKSVECDYDIHPWEILINGERWPGKIRLIGFVDVFFLICYSADARFEKGIVIHKDDDAIRSTLDRAGIDASKIELEVVNKTEREKDSNVLPKYFGFKSDAIDYIITSLGHEIGLKTEYPASSLIKYEIKLRKNKSRIMKSKYSHVISVERTVTNLAHTTERIRRGVNQHSLIDLMQDAIRLGIITHAEVTAQLMGQFFVGSSTDDVMRKYMDTLAATSRPGEVTLSNEKT